MDTTLTTALSHIQYTTRHQVNKVETRQEEIKLKTGRTIRHLLFAVVAMFGFGFALVPLYDVFCDITGLNGKTDGKYLSTEQVEINRDRLVTIQFMTNNNDGMNWHFRPLVKSVKVHPGELNAVSFYAKNSGQSDMVAQAVPSISPFYAADYFHKTECFCFEQQFLAHGDEIEMPLRFIVDLELPEEINTLTLSYTLFDITDIASNSY